MRRPEFQLRTIQQEPNLTLALWKLWMEGRNSPRGSPCCVFVN